MRIAIFTNNYLPNLYGVSTSVETFRREFEKKRHTVFIFAPKFPGYKDENQNVYRYPSLDINIKFRFPLAIPYSWKMRKILKKLDLDIIHAQHPNLLGMAALKWAKRKKIPLVFTWHTLYDKYTNFVPFLPKSLAGKYIINKAVKFADKADAVVVPTDSIIPMLRKWGVKNKNIIPVSTGVVEEDFQEFDRDKVRKKYNIEENETVVLTVSRLTEEKNAELLFHSLRKVLLEKPVKFLVAGDGYLSSSLKEFCQKEKISEKVIFAGAIDRDEIKNYYAAADIFVYASKSETQGMIISEAMYMGLPIVAVSATGTNSLVLNNGNGFLVSESEKEFEEAALKLIEDKNLRYKFGEVSKKIARTQFTAGVCAEKMLEVYEEAIAKNNPSS